MTSLYEGLPLTLVEAQANGLKCFVSKGNVPYESKVIDTLEFIPLKKGEKEWANIIKNSDKTRLANSTEMLYENHFGIRDEIQGLEKIYLCSAN
jgi:hypothetical protein